MAHILQTRITKAMRHTHMFLRPGRNTGRWAGRAGLWLRDRACSPAKWGRICLGKLVSLSARCLSVKGEAECVAAGNRGGDGSQGVNVRLLSSWEPETAGAVWSSRTQCEHSEASVELCLFADNYFSQEHGLE